ncbi:MAG: ParA family protein, partial [Kangiellaceae bacterium]|nr:ParA family protein [Kangiellaceae bacterium]
MNKQYPKVVSVVNLKGGVGKTTLCANLAYGLAYFKQKKVLLVDLDPQANATQYLISQKSYRDIYLMKKTKKTIVELYYEISKDNYNFNDQENKNIIISQFIQRVYTALPDGYLDILASKLELGLLNVFGNATIRRFNQLKKFIDLTGSNYEFIIVDCPPTISDALFVGLFASDYVLIPIKPDFLSSIGFPLLHKIITETYPDCIPNASNIKVLGIIYNMVDTRLNMTKESIAEVNELANNKDYQYHIFNSQISYTTKFSWSSKTALPIFRTEPASRYA